MNDKDFDALFKQAAEQHRVPYNPNAWVKMRRKLDGGAGWWTRGKIITGLALLLLMGGIFGVIWWNREPTPEQSTVVEMTQTDTNASTTGGATSAGERGQEETTSSAPQSSASETQGEERRQPDNDANIASATQGLPENSRQNQSRDTEEDAGGKTEADNQHFEVAMQGFNSGNGIGYLTGNAISDQSPTPGVPSVSPVAILMETESEDTTLEIIPEKQHQLVHRWRISLGVSPDISAINLGEATQVGSKASVGLEFFLLPRLSVQTGVIFSNKLYQATGESYKPYPGYWKKYQMPNSIDAHCDVLDIPINIRYYAFDTPKNRIFISGGVSSYLMLTEDYVYKYKGHGYQKPYSYEHHERNKNQHYFKVANISLGYERALSKRWALQVEPFVKIPVAGVGFGKIKLSTTGMFMSLNYRLHR